MASRLPLFRIETAGNKEYSFLLCEEQKLNLISEQEQYIQYVLI